MGFQMIQGNGIDAFYFLLAKDWHYILTPLNVIADTAL
jgi:hypothetical protein